jgi:hypothetical protein
VQKPAPALGLVVRFDYLWSDEARRGRTEGTKQRPCAIVVAQTGQGRNARVWLAPITHSPPRQAGDAIAIPPRVKAALGLDDEPSWIVTTELNSAAWDDAGIVPAAPDRWAYGFLPTALIKAVVDMTLSHQRARRNIVKRDA